jgi:hypothetical protein
MEAGDMYWLTGASYLIDLEPEIFNFPKSKKKDQVDCHSMIADILSSPHGPVMWSPEGQSQERSLETVPLVVVVPVPSLFEKSPHELIDDDDVVEVVEEWK